MSTYTQHGPNPRCCYYIANWKQRFWQIKRGRHRTMCRLVVTVDQIRNFQIWNLDPNTKYWQKNTKHCHSESTKNDPQLLMTPLEEIGLGRHEIVNGATHWSPKMEPLEKSKKNKPLSLLRCNTLTWWNPEFWRLIKLPNQNSKLGDKSNAKLLQTTKDTCVTWIEWCVSKIQ